MLISWIFFIFTIILVILAIVFYLVLDTFCILIAVLFWLLFGFVVGSLLLAMLGHFLNKGRRVEVTKKTTIINKTNCEGHAALIVREKRTRPEGDLGSILEAYKEQADREEYSFNMTMETAYGEPDLTIVQPKTPLLSRGDVKWRVTEPPEINYTKSQSSISSSEGGIVNEALGNLELVFLIEGSDSFSENGSADGKAFEHSIAWATELTSKIYHNCDLNSFYVSMIQFSGLKQSVGSYKPGSWGTDATTGHLHYQKFYGPQDISDDSHRKPFEGNLHVEVEPLSGCDYMYLCLQDITSKEFFNDPRRIASDSKKILIIIGDGDWDDETGRDRRSKHDVLKQAHQIYDHIFTIVSPSQNFEFKKEGNVKLRTILEEQVSKPAHEGFYLVTKKNKFREEMRIHSESIFYKIAGIFNSNRTLSLQSYSKTSSGHGNIITINSASGGHQTGGITQRIVSGTATHQSGTTSTAYSSKTKVTRTATTESQISDRTHQV